MCLVVRLLGHVYSWSVARTKAWCFISCAVSLLVLGGNDQLHQSDLHSELHRGTGRSII